jgi:spindle assembly abnormal protein 6
MFFQLTDEADPFFLYTLRVSEEEFQVLKTDQSILVDFSEFPAKFMELLQCCVSASTDDSPKFGSSLINCGEGAHLSIVETNHFKNLTHLKLEFRYVL